MRALFAFSFVMLMSSLSAQTYFYVDALEVIPENPTTEDVVSIHVFGYLSSTGSYITDHSIYVGLDNVLLTINCASSVGATVIVPHDTIFEVGIIPIAGTYNITLSGMNLGDFVSDPSMYEFIVTEPNGIEEKMRSSVTWTTDDRGMLISNELNSTIQLGILDLHGRLIDRPATIAKRHE